MKKILAVALIAVGFGVFAFAENYRKEGQDIIDVRVVSYSEIVGKVDKLDNEINAYLAERKIAEDRIAEINVFISTAQTQKEELEELLK